MGRGWFGLVDCAGMIERQYQEERNDRLKEGARCSNNTAVPRPSAFCVLHAAFTIRRHCFIKERLKSIHIRCYWDKKTKKM